MNEFGEKRFKCKFCGRDSIAYGRKAAQRQYCSSQCKLDSKLIKARNRRVKRNMYAL